MTLIRYKGLKINRIQSSSGLFIGTNIQNGRISRNEINEGFGSINGPGSKVSNNHTLFRHDNKGLIKGSEGNEQRKDQ
ncbi:hypothetical protein A8F94_13695 [Bacillus sp. FJAT-27225]|uniref:hypothetical protein n=1 Tax=Bacillus sp. FJAT-27225 TaxID=1743144 RepID=UPI00080C3124|nr:hypothetical protein [Bacillus sp. FJAT-27225]OCA85900.1 hypothetical protein A8F94_13695 [Bacillus sp. FJAT-27225]